MFHIDFILAVWLKNVPDYAPIFAKLILGYSLVNVLTQPTWSVALAFGDLKKYIVIGSLVSFSAFPISYMLLQNGMRPFVVLVANIIVRFVYLWVVLLIIKKYIPLSLKKYCKSVMHPIVLVVGTSCVLCFVLNAHMINHVFLCGVLNIVITFMSIFVMGLNEYERLWVWKRIKKVLKR